MGSRRSNHEPQMIQGHHRAALKAWVRVPQTSASSEPSLKAQFKTIQEGLYFPPVGEQLPWQLFWEPRSKAMAPCFQRTAELQSLERVISLRLGWICGKTWMPMYPDWHNSSLCLLWMQRCSRSRGRALTFFTDERGPPLCTITFWDSCGLKRPASFSQGGAFPHTCWEVILRQQLWLPRIWIRWTHCHFPYFCWTRDQRA